MEANAGKSFQMQINLPATPVKVNFLADHDKILPGGGGLLYGTDGDARRKF